MRQRCRFISATHHLSGMIARIEGRFMSSISYMLEADAKHGSEEKMFEPLLKIFDMMRIDDA